MSLAHRLPEPWLTAEAFKTWPGDGTGRAYQLIDGELVAMAPASLTHGRLQARLATELNLHLRRHRPDCEAITAPSVQPRAYADHNVRVPDLAVGCGLGRTHYLDAPVLIAEILSPSNMRETMEAVRACLSIPSIREVLILASESIGAEVFRRGPGGDWSREPDRLGPADVVTLDSLGFACPMAALYEGLGLD